MKNAYGLNNEVFQTLNQKTYALILFCGSSLEKALLQVWSRALRKMSREFINHSNELDKDDRLESHENENANPGDGPPREPCR